MNTHAPIQLAGNAATNCRFQCGVAEVCTLPSERQVQYDIITATALKRIKGHSKTSALALINDFQNLTALEVFIGTFQSGPAKQFSAKKARSKLCICNKRVVNSYRNRKIRVIYKIHGSTHERLHCRSRLLHWQRGSEPRGASSAPFNPSKSATVINRLVYVTEGDLKQTRRCRSLVWQNYESTYRALQFLLR